MKKKTLALLMAAIVAIPTVSLMGCGKKESADVVIIGAGGAGLSAAIQAKQDGAKNVVVLEKMPMVGGNTNRATGGLNAAGTKQQQEKGIEDSAEVMFEDTMKGGHQKNNPELVKKLSEEAKDSVAWLTDLGADLNDVGRLAGATNYRAHRPTGGAPVGAELVKTLNKSAKDQKIDVRLWNKASEIVLDKEGKVCGVKATDKDSKEYTIDTKAVIVAGGGFGANQEMVVKYKPELKGFSTTNHNGATGDGIVLAEKAGADLVDMAEIQTHPTVVPEKAVMVSEAVRGNGAILINKEGKRFINELLTRDVVSKGILDQPDKQAYLFFDDGLRKSLKSTEEYFNMGLVTEADSVEDLAAKLEIDPATMKATVDKYNQGVAAKSDEFQRPDLPRELNQGKVYAILVAPAVHHTMGGIKINTNAEVLNKDGKVIPGLFAAGEVTGGVHGGNRLGGNALADIVTYGRTAGKDAVKYINQ
ncbi:flavocytochrome c [Clostridium fallax]|uniref:Fumarate reductase flavoprotein subunit n=1 Tax=Clostridium fallax TaxID=1533 RepID=A0A1M4W4C0_9CLOT|nr:flavocytochrome c [Clostridium fallax]SHE75995.1 fumarate reductase flavoprotein subunit [Clostridium fallax]SQB22870.1 fumarate reductase flavoprotein [Clostridium fallax]